MNDLLSPATLDQFLTTPKGQVLIDADSCSVVKDLQAIDPSLNVRFVDQGEPYFVVFQRIEHPDGRVDDHMVTTVKAVETSFGTWTGLDQRLVERIRKITHPSYDLTAEQDRIKAEHEAARKAKAEDQLGDAGEQMAHAIRKDLGFKGKIFVKDGV